MYILCNVRVGISLIGFSSESLVFCEQKSDASESLTVALLLESQANHSHHSFLKSDESASLMSLFCKISDFERIPNPVQCEFPKCEEYFPQIFPYNISVANALQGSKQHSWARNYFF